MKTPIYILAPKFIETLPADLLNELENSVLRSVKKNGKRGRVSNLDFIQKYILPEIEKQDIVMCFLRGTLRVGNTDDIETEMLNNKNYIKDFVSRHLLDNRPHYKNLLSYDLVCAINSYMSDTKYRRYDQTSKVNLIRDAIINISYCRYAFFNCSYFTN